MVWLASWAAVWLRRPVQGAAGVAKYVRIRLGARPRRDDAPAVFADELDSARRARDADRPRRMVHDRGSKKE